MMINRRSFLMLSLASALPWSVAGWGQARGDREMALTLRPETRDWFGPNHDPIHLWGSSEPSLMLKQGEPVAIRVDNQLPQATSLHWHGLRVANAMDGVSGLTQQPIAPEQSFVYRFTPNDAGTFWAHAHHNTFEQLARGLYLPLIVQEAIPYPADQDLLFVLDDWRVNSQRQLDLASLGNVHEWAHGGRKGNILTVNRQPASELPVKAGQRIRLRVLNAANARIMALELPGVKVWLLAKDGQPLAQPLPLREALVLSPAERYDLIIDIPSDWAGRFPIYEVSGQEQVEASHWQVSGQAAGGGRGVPAPLLANPLPALGDDEPVHRVTLDMEGGAMGRMREAVYQGQMLPIGELVEQKQVWAFNGVANLPDQPLVTVRPGELVEVTINNNTRWPHGMHLHGHHFQTRSPLYPDGLWHDTLLMAGGDSVVIRFRAGAPGKWLLHCHMIEHQAAGMVTWIEVSG